MRLLALIGLCLAATMLTACGGGDSSEESSATVGRVEKAPVPDSAKPPKVQLPPGPSPRRLIVRDLKEGTGAPIPPHLGVRVHTNFVALGYRTGKPTEIRWRPTGAFNIGLEPGKEIEGWEKGLVGMKAGGRRELLIPGRMAYGNEAIYYLIDLLSIEWPPFG